MNIDVFLGGRVARDEMDVAFDQAWHHEAIAVIDNRIRVRKRRRRSRFTDKIDQAIIADNDGLIGRRGVF